MKALVYEKYGAPEVLQLIEVEKPVPKDDEVLIEIHATATNAVDWRLLRADPSFVRLFAGLLKPKYRILGADIAGKVEAIGKNITQFKPGDAIFGSLSESGFGGFSEYVCAPKKHLVSMPANLSFEQAAAVPMAAVTALQGLRDAGQIQSGQKILIHGASGGVGTFAVQIAKSFGADVTAVCSTSKMDMARSLGADHVIDYTQEDFAIIGQQYDLILAINGNQRQSTAINGNQRQSNALRLPAGAHTNRHVCSGRRLYVAIVPGHSPWAHKIQIWRQDHTKLYGETKPEGFAFYEDAA